MEAIKIGHTDVILQELGENQGKIIISHWDSYNFSHYWGSMGGTLKEFLCQINVGYFVNKLCPYDRRTVFDAKRTATAFRKEIKKFLPWYKHMEFQKEMREEVNNIEHCSNEFEFVRWAENFIDNLWFDMIEDEYDRKEIKSEFGGLMSEFWLLQETTDSREAKFLADIFPKIQEEVKKIIELKPA